MSKVLFSFYLDEDLKSQASKKAEEENRSLANLIETAIIQFLNPSPIGARVTVKTVKTGDKKTYGEFTARVKHVSREEKTVLLDEADPVTGWNIFPLDHIISVHLI